MADFKITMQPQLPTPQRVAAAWSLKELAPRQFEEALRNKNFVPFIEGIQRNWRNWLSIMKEAGYAVLDGKKFGYARNCPPVLVSSEVSNAAGLNVRLVPCRLPACPFCNARAVMKIQETLSATLTNLEKFDTLNFVSYDVSHTPYADTSLEDCVQEAESLWSTLGGPDCAGVISRRVFWVEPSPPGYVGVLNVSRVYNGRLSFIQINPENPCRLSQDLGLPTVDCRYDAYYPVQAAPSNKDLGAIAKHIGKTFAYPPMLLSRKDTADAAASMLNELHKKKRRFYRTAGICRGNSSQATPSRQTSTKSWRHDVNEKLDVIVKELAELKEMLAQKG